jgi:hypothetical protein
MTTAHIVAHRSTSELLAIIENQQAIIEENKAEIAELSMSHLGILAPAAIRRALRLMTDPCDLICIDLRKMHDLNAVLGYDVTNMYFGIFARTRTHDDPFIAARSRDVRGQWGGDEVVIACAPGDGQGLLMRLIAALDKLTAALTPAQRHSLAMRTGNLVDGWAAVFVLIPNTTDPYHREWIGDTWVDAGDVKRGVNECGKLKEGNITGSRSTSGRPGTIIGTLAPLAQ